MSPQFSAVLELVDAYLAIDDFWTLWHQIAGPGGDHVSVEDMNELEQKCFDSLYDIVYMGQRERTTSSEHAVGTRGGSDLRALIQAWRVDVGRAV